MIFPFTRRTKLKGSNGINWPGFILLDEDLEYPAAVWAQEAYESKLKLNPINFFKRATSTKFRREMELFSHEIETQVAVRFYKVDETNYRNSEARTLHHNYDGIFRKYSYEELSDKMLANKNKANKWIDKNKSDIKKFL